ncbi:manganese catalase family protein [Actinomycetospora flava]|uniref:Manganese catalase family protein n=1 Tax=Actinomycetospora flava TaxID=3129232 RepID=A0ABU8M9M9_9PSEU
MFRHTSRLQFTSKPDKPDALYAMKLQELIGGAWGEMTVSQQYLFQGWNCRVPGKYKDMIMDIATEEIGHVEMLATMVARLLEGAPSETVAGSLDGDAATAAIIGGMNPQHAIVGGGGALPSDSNGNPWMGSYIVSSGNLLADFRVNVAAESQGRLQTARLYNMTDDYGVREMLKFNLARDTMHQLQWLAAIEQLQEDGLGGVVVPDALLDEENQEHSRTLWGLSDGQHAHEGKWAQGTAPDGAHEFTYLNNPDPLGDIADAPAPDPMLYATYNTSHDGIIGKVKDKLGS